VTRRRLYLMRHADVAYFDARGRPLRPQDVSLTPEGETQAGAAAAAFEGIRFDRVVTSGLPRTLETARLAAPEVESESWPELRELEPGRLADIPPGGLEEAFLGAFRGVVPEDRRFLEGETVGSLLDRVLPALERLLADEAWDVVLAVLHGGSTARSSPTRSPAGAYSSAASSRRRAASTSSMSATTGSSAR
jgi:broad specificity phosphatase PhoE